MSGQLAFPLSGDDKSSFDNFWVGHNSELVAAIKASVSLGEPRMLYYYGVASSGKSHLLFAATRLAKAEIVTTSYLSLTDSHVNPDLLSAVAVGHLVCIDNVQAWAGDKQKESALFTLFEQVKHAGGRLIVSAVKPPESSGFVLLDLISRLSSGLIYPLQELNEGQHFEVIKMRAKLRGLSITDDVVRYLLSRSDRNTSELLATLDKIDQASLIEKRRVTIPFLQRLLASDKVVND